MNGNLVDLVDLRLRRAADAAEADAYARHPARALGRMAAFFAGVRGEVEPPATGPGRALNARMYVPGLTARPWWEARAFPLAAQLRARLGLLREEALRLLVMPGAFARSPGAACHGASEDLRGTWLAYYLHRHFHRVREAAGLAPCSLRALDDAALSREAMLSFLSPGASIGPHSDRLNFVVTLYMPLFTAPGAWIRFGGEARPWVEGRCEVADSTYMHDSANDTAHWRGLLIVDMWHPELDAVERAVLSAALPGIDEILRAGRAA